MAVKNDEIRDESVSAKLESDSERPFSLRHAMQQASIVGNMQKSGLLQVICAQQSTRNLPCHDKGVYIHLTFEILLALNQSVDGLVLRVIYCSI